MFCTSCGFRITVNANFCSNCGKEKPAEPAAPQPKVNHPWMTAQPSPQEHSQEVAKQPSQQDRGEMPEVLRRIQGWSTKKKILWGVVAGFLFLTCVAVAVAEPVEDGVVNPKPKPLLETLQAEFVSRGFEYHNSLESLGIVTETWRHPDGGNLRLSDGDDYKSVKLSFPLLDTTLTDEQQNAMGDFVEMVIPTWAEGGQWVTENLPITMRNPVPTSADDAAFRSKNFAKKHHPDIVGNLEAISVRLTKNHFDERPVGVVLIVDLYD